MRCECKAIIINILISLRNHALLGKWILRFHKESYSPWH